MRVGLTGAGGILGRRLADELAKCGHQVIPFVGDIRDASTLNSWSDGLDQIVHSAALVPTKEVEERLEDAIAVNTFGTANVARTATRNSVHLTYISTSHVYADSNAPISERGRVGPVSFYGLTKLHGEDWVRMICKDHLIIRVFSFFDSQQRPPYLVPSLAQRIQQAPKGASLELQSGSSVRDIADATWIAQVCVKLISQKPRLIVNCGTGVGHTVSSIANSLSRALNRPDISWNAGRSTTSNSLVASVQLLVDTVGPLPDSGLERFMEKFVEDCATSQASRRG